MKRKIQKRLAGLLILLAVTAWSAAENREDPYPAPAQGKHLKRIYVAADGKRYVARELPLYFHISPTPDGEDAVLLENEEILPPAAAPLLPEGLNVLKRTGPAAAKGTLPAPRSDLKYEIYVDGTPPVTRAVFSGAPLYEKEGSRFYGKGLIMDLISRDVLSGVREAYLSVNGKPYAPQRTAFGDIPADSLIHLRYYAVDRVGNVEKPLEDIFYLDLSPPRSDLQVKGNYDAGTLSPGSVLEFSARDALSGVKEIHYKWDEGTESAYSGNIEPGGLTEGNHALHYYALDQTGNVEEAQTYRFFYDKSAPVVDVSVVGDNGKREGIVFVSGAARIRLEAADNHAGTAALRYTIDAGEEQDYEEPFPLPLPGGVHKITYRAADKVGNWSKSRTWSVYLDLTPPEPQYQISGYYASGQQELVLRKDVSVFLVSTDLEAGVKEIHFRIDDGEASIYKDSLEFTADGEYTLTYWGVDGVNNREEKKKLELRVDNSLSAATGKDSAGRYPRQWYADKTGELTGTVDLPFYLFLSTSAEDNSQVFLLDLPKLGADTGQSIVFKQGGIDYLQLRAGGPGLTVGFDARDDQKGIVSGYRETYVSLDDSPFFTYTTPLKVFSREKAYRFRYYSVDNVGNAEPVREMAFTVDTTPPVTTWKVSGMTQGRILSAQSLVELSAVDNLTGVKDIFYRFDAEPEKKYGRVLETSELSKLSSGEHTLFFYALDHTGNREKTGKLAFYFDKAEHTLELKVSGDRFDKGEVVYVSARSRLGFVATGEQTPVKIIVYRVDGGQETRYDNTFFQLKGESGKHILRYSGSDAVGNTSKKQTQVIFIDTEPPQTQLKLDGPVFRNRFSTFTCSRTLMELSARDDHSGVKSVYYRVDGSPAQEYRGPFPVLAGGKHTLTYYASDMVHNVENPRQMTIYTDNEPPDLRITYNTVPRKAPLNGVSVFPRNLVIDFSAVDAQTEVDKIIYRFDKGKEHLYRNLISNFDTGKVYTLTVYTLDRLGNKREQTVVFRVE